jgi:anti-anti-sigma factor
MDLMVDYEVTDREGDRASLLLRGELTGDVPSVHLKKQLERHYVDDGVREIRVDLEGLTRISLEGIRILLDLWRESQQRGKRLVLQDAQGQVRSKLETTGLIPSLEAPGRPEDHRRIDASE